MKKSNLSYAEGPLLSSEIRPEVFVPPLKMPKRIAKKKDKTNVLGISAYYHDSAICLTQNGEIVYAVEEERFSRKKHDNRFPHLALRSCIETTHLAMEDLDLVVFYEDPFLKLRRTLTHNAFNPESTNEKILKYFTERLCLENILEQEFNYKGPIEYSHHHYSHAASTYYPSPFEKALILTIDGVGEYTTAALFRGVNNKITKIKDLMVYPNSLGLLYSTITAFLGFKVNNDEYKVMGLASYGRPLYRDKFYELILDPRPENFTLNMDYFSFNKSNEIMFNENFSALFGIPARQQESNISEEHKNIASTLQAVTEENVVSLCKWIHQEYPEDNLCLAGGVALNCVANWEIFTQGPFKHIFVQPAAGDAGGSIGAALLGYHLCLSREREINHSYTSLFGPGFSDRAIEELLDEEFIEYKRYDDDELLMKTAQAIFENKVVGWFQGRMEFGPRALGNRSILANPCHPDTKDILNQKVKHREDFRPFAPAVLSDKQHPFFNIPFKSPYMLFVCDVKQGKAKDIPSVTHTDGTARIQSVTYNENPLFYRLIEEFEKISGVPVLINTSFNVRGEPIVCTPRNAFECFLRTGIDLLVMGNYVVDKTVI